MCLKLKVTIRLWVCECEQNEEKPNARSDSTRNLWSQNQKMLKLKNGCPWYFPPHLTSPWCWAGAGAQLGRWGPYITPWGAKPAQERGTGGTTGNDIKHPLRIPRTEQWAGSISLHGSLVPGWGWGWLSDWWWTNDARIVGDTPQKIIGGVIISIISCLDTRNDHYLCGNSDIQISAHLNLPLRSISSNVCELANGLLRIMRMYPNFKQQLTKTWPYPHRGWSQCPHVAAGGAVQRNLSKSPTEESSPRCCIHQLEQRRPRSWLCVRQVVCIGDSFLFQYQLTNTI